MIGPWRARLWTMFAAVTVALLVYGVAMGRLTRRARWMRPTAL